MTTTTTECIDLAIIGGGPAGLAAALAATAAGARPVVLDGRCRLAETIKPTGDGRCNISNMQVSPEDYRHADFVRRVFLACPPKQVRGFLQGHGIMLREEAQGRLYPVPNKSTAVIEALLFAMRRARVNVRVGKGVQLVRRNTEVWTITFDDGTHLRAQSVIVCTGGGLKRDFLPHAVSVVPAQPVLAPLACKARPLRGLDKIRVKCALHYGDVVERGEVTFRTYGVSGICAFNVSRLVSPGDRITLDFAPDVPISSSVEFLRERLESMAARSWVEFTSGMLLPQVTNAVLQAAGLDRSACPTSEDLEPFNTAWRSFPLTVEGIGEAKLAQVRRGGVDVAGLDPHTMALRGMPGLYVAGEAVDVDGPCGGYNLHWAWTSGIVAGRAAAHELYPQVRAKHASPDAEQP